MVFSVLTLSQMVLVMAIRSERGAKNAWLTRRRAKKKLGACPATVFGNALTLPAPPPQPA